MSERRLCGAWIPWQDSLLGKPCPHPGRFLVTGPLVNHDRTPFCGVHVRKYRRFGGHTVEPIAE